MWARLEDLSRCLSVCFLGLCIEGKNKQGGVSTSLILGWMKEGRCSLWAMRVGVPARLQPSPPGTRGQESTLPPSPDWVRIYFPSLGQLSPQARNPKATVELVLQENEKSLPRRKRSPQPIRSCACRSFALHICIFKLLVMIFFFLLEASIDVPCR